MTTDRLISYAQNLEDVMLWRALGAAVEGPGFYIDIGAADPTALSVTRAFYDRGWHGLNVEPLPEQAARLTSGRPRDTTIQCAVAAQPGQRRFHRVISARQTGLSTLDPAEAAHHRENGAEVEELEVRVHTLAELCAAHVTGPVHFLKIDAEGAEAEVVAGADFAVTRPWIILIEATKPLTTDMTDAAWEPGLFAAGYRFRYFDGLNRFYLADEHAGLGHHFDVPPNVFDNYIQFDPVLSGHMEETQVLADSRKGVIEILEAELARISAAAPPPSPVPPAPLPPSPMPSSPVPEPAAEEPAPQPGWRGLLRRLVFAAYWPFRPLVRPVFHRSRMFFTADMSGELADLRSRQQLADDKLDLINAKQDLANAKIDGIADHLQPSDLDPGLGGAMERLLLTLALEGERGRCDRCLVRPADEP